MIYPKVFMTTAQLTQLPEYSTTLPTGTTEGKKWRKARRPWRNEPEDEWLMGRYGRPYHDAHEHAGRIPIIWRQIVVTDAPRVFPVGVFVPPAPMRGRHREIRPGDDEGQTCFREHDGKLCQGVIEYLPPSDGSCGCSHSPMPPCGWCVSTLPECPTCGWRDEE